MKVFIVTEGGKGIGFGHITRCLSLYEAFANEGIKPLFVVKGDSSVKNLLRGKRKILFDWIKEEKKLLDFANGSDIVVIDSYLANKGIYYKLAGVVNTLVYIDDNRRLSYPRGLIVNGSVYAKKLQYRRKRWTRHLLGTDYTLLRKEFFNVPKKRIRNEIKNILVTFGGDDKKNVTPKILEILQKEYPAIDKYVIVGNGFREKGWMSRLADKKTHLICNPNADRIKRLMMKSDVAISAAGQTVHELARAGVPAIILSVAANQLKNASWWKRTGFLEYIGHYNTKNYPKKLKRAFEKLKKRNARKEMSRKGRSLIDGKGSARVAKAILSTSSKDKILVRKAKARDCRDIFNLANDSLVRRNSFNPEVIKWKNHVEWFNGKLRDGNYAFFVFVHAGKIYGQTRFSIFPERKEAVVSISLARPIRGLGMASLLLNSAMDKLLKKHKDIKTIKAYVKDKNRNSMQLFKNAFFTFSGNTAVNGCKTHIYKRGIGKI